MTARARVAVLVGSLRQGSNTRKLAHGMASLTETLDLEIVEIGDLPFYEPGLEDAVPESVTRFRTALGGAAGILFVTPEYNRATPAVMKNAVDVASRPKASSVLAGRPVAVVSNSPGLLGGALAHHHLRQSLVGAGATVMSSPEVYVSQVTTLMDDEGTITNEGTRKFLGGFLSRFARWIEVNGAAR